MSFLLFFSNLNFKLFVAQLGKDGPSKCVNLRYYQKKHFVEFLTLGRARASGCSSRWSVQ